MRYNETNSEQVGGRNIIEYIEDDNTIIEVSAQVMSDISGKLQANYDLIVYGSIDVDSLTVMGSLVCFGNCKADNMNVQGRCDIFGALEVNDALFSDDLRVREIVAERIEVTGKVICDSIDCREKFIGHNSILVSEGIMGEGKWDSNLIICGEYAFTEEKKHVFVVNEIDEQTEKRDPAVCVDLSMDVSEMDWSECEDYLRDLSREKPDYRGDYEAYLELVKWSDNTKIKSLNQYICLAELLCREGEKYRESDLYNVIKEELFDKAYNYIFDMQIRSLSQKDFIGLNYKLYESKDIIPDDVYRFLREELYSKIGLKYNTVVMMLGE
ncbi:hypothetical protein SAMN06296386_1159 [Lachnospiraceae bacterium]|nr:hypothetical protein SAMN06296386_1159 [Lachnospiraceae bacterium]